MRIRPVQTVFSNSNTTVNQLGVTLPRPTTVGNSLSLYLRFSPLTGTPNLSDSFGNQYRQVGISGVSATEAVGFWAADIRRGGANHVVTAGSQGGPQNLEVGVSELSVLGPTPHETHTAEDILFGILAQQFQQTALLQQLLDRRY